MGPGIVFYAKFFLLFFRFFSRKYTVKTVYHEIRRNSKKSDFDKIEKSFFLESIKSTLKSSMISHR